ncbi:ATP-binding protein [Sulfitobacter geojensis]|uniref:ATP-binding protein n=1 Tax=Sulfitobacter geojensis TaxID=1342299 RepID=UPI003BAAC533
MGGTGGEEALARLKQTFSRVGTGWRPASQEESYEIVRRRLFKEVSADNFRHRDNTLKQFAKLYRENSSDFPQGCADEDYRRKLEKAYPIHPEVFDQLYTSWGALEKFQRTRGVLRLMAQVIHELWMNNDPSVMIMPGSIAISSPRVEPELLHYLNIAWQSIIDGDVDGVNSTPYKIDQSAPNLNRFSATRRVARTVFLATAPSRDQENRGLDDRRINLGVVQPGEKAAIFSDALRRLANNARFMHGDMGRYWYSMSASLNRLAADRAAEIEDALIQVEVDKALASYIGGIGDRGFFDAVQVCPGNSLDVPDEPGGVRIVVLGVRHPHTGRPGSEAEDIAKDILSHRGTSPRVYRNTLVFLAADRRQLDNLQEAIRLSRAWNSILNETDRLNLRQSDISLAKDKVSEAQNTVATRLKEAWCYLLFPTQDSATSELEWSSAKIPSQEGLLARASKKLVSDEGLFTELGPARLNRELEKYIWNGRSQLHLKDIWEYSNRYIYLPRLRGRTVLIACIQAAISGIVPGPFAYAENYEEGNGYEGLHLQNSGHAIVTIDDRSILVAADAAEEEFGKLAAQGESDRGHDGGNPVPPERSEGTSVESDSEGLQPEDAVALPTRFVGSVQISSDRPAHEMRQVVEAIVEQLTDLPGSKVSLLLEIDAEVPSGLDKSVVRTLTENANTLGFKDKLLK